jgi:hypothetical protein
MAIGGPPAVSTAVAPASWKRSAKLTTGCLAATGASRVRATSRPLLAPWPASFLKRMEPLAPPRAGKAATFCFFWGGEGGGGARGSGGMEVEVG